MDLFDFKGYGGAPATVPLQDIRGLTCPVRSVRTCELWVAGQETPFVVTEPFEEVRSRLADAKRIPDLGEFNG